MKLDVVVHPKTQVIEAFIGSLKVGVFEQMDRQGPYSFMSHCPHEKLTGDHYILIGQHLNTLNTNSK